MRFTRNLTFLQKYWPYNYLYLSLHKSARKINVHKSISPILGLIYFDIHTHTSTILLQNSGCPLIVCSDGARGSVLLELSQFFTKLEYNWVQGLISYVDWYASNFQTSIVFRIRNHTSRIQWVAIC